MTAHSYGSDRVPSRSSPSEVCYDARVSSRLAWVGVTVGLPRDLMRTDALMKDFFWSTHNFLCKCGERVGRIDRHLASGGWRNTRSMAKTSGKAL